MYEDIINGIKSNLGENKDLNKQYLVNQIEVYKDHPYSKEIIREISRMIWDCLSDEEKEEYIRISENENPIMDILDEIFPYIQHGQYETAMEILEKFMKTFPEMFEDDKVSEYHSFTNPLEEIIFDEYVGAEKEIRLIPDNQPVLDLYYVYGFLLLEKKKLPEAEKYLKKALKINPVSARVLLELSEIYKINTPNFNRFFMYTEEALKYAYYPQDIARCYRNLGYYFIEEEMFKEATALFEYSMNYEMSPMAYSELQYIKSKGFDFELTALECESIIREKNIQLGPNPFILDNMEKLIREYEENSFYNQAAYFYELYYNLTHDEKILERLKELEAMINN